MKTVVKIRKAAWLAATSSIVALGLGSAAQAAGFYLQEQSALAVGRAFSGEAADQGPSSLWWNPAAIAGLTHASGYVSGAEILPSGNANNTGTVIIRPGQAPAGVGGSASTSNPIKDGFLPSAGFAVPINDRIVAGVAITSPFSFQTQYDSTSWARYSALKTSLTTIDIQPTVAFVLTNWLRLGVGVNAEYSDATLSNALPNLSPLLPDGVQQLKGNGWNYGWSAGAQMHNDLVTVGLTYKSSVQHQLNGSVNVTGLLGPLAGNNMSVGTQATFNTPWQAIAAARFKATDRLTLNAQVVRAGWSEFSAITLGAPINAALPEGYRDTWSLAGGFDYALAPRWTVRGGLQTDQTPTQNGQRDARVPDGDRWTLALGGSYQATPAFAIDVGANYVSIANASIDRTTAGYVGTPVQTPILMNGNLNNAHAIVLALGGRFGF
jgi:long-chain fatty acid transport protein